MRTTNETTVAMKLYDLVGNEPNEGIYTNAALQRLPLPAILVDARTNNQIIILGREIIEQLKNGQANLPRNLQRRLDETPITIIYIDHATDEETEQLITIHKR